MIDCKNCYHYEACKSCYELAGYTIGENIKPSQCPIFKDKVLIAELPCKIGDKLYFVPDAGYILTCTVAAIHISDEKSVRKKLHKSHIIAISHISGLGMRMNFDTFGKIIFRTREEAEQVSKESENNDG